VGFVVDKSGTGAGFLRVLGFPWRFPFHQMLHNHLSSRAGTIGQLEADVLSGLSLTPPHEIKKIIKSTMGLKGFHSGQQTYVSHLKNLFENKNALQHNCIDES
jgi:hypothetical protein